MIKSRKYSIGISNCVCKSKICRRLLAQKKFAKSEAEKNATVNGPDLLDLQKDASKQVADLKFKIQELERENTGLQGNVIRLDSQLKRYKTQAEQAEKEVAELKQANRALTKQIREKENSLDEARETNKHLQNRLEKVKTTRRPL